jgi:hypothetical protein
VDGSVLEGGATVTGSVVGVVAGVAVVDVGGADVAAGSVDGDADGDVTGAASPPLHEASHSTPTSAIAIPRVAGTPACIGATVARRIDRRVTPPCEDVEA